MAHTGVPSIDLDSVSAEGLCVAVISATWNAEITDVLHQRAVEAAKVAGAVVEEFRVAGALELPLAVKTACEHYDAVIALGCVIRGETEHFRLVCDAVNQGLMQVTLDTNTPIGNGVLTVDNRDQALDRIGGVGPDGDGAHEDKGYDATMAALQLASEIRKISRSRVS